MQHIIEEIYQEALNDELNKLAGIEKVALSGKTLASFARKKEVQNAMLRQSKLSLEGNKAATRSDTANMVNSARSRINEALRESRSEMSTKPIREYAGHVAEQNRFSKKYLRRAMKNPVVNEKKWVPRTSNRGFYL